MVVRDRVLGRPAVGDLVEAPVLAGERFEPLESLLDGLAGAGWVAFTADDQQLPVRAHRACHRAGADRHPLRWRTVGERRRDAVGALRFQSREVQAAIEYRVMGGDDYVLRAYLTLSRDDGAWCALADPQSPGVLEHDRPVAVDGGGEALQVANGVQLHLVVEMNRAVRLIRKITRIAEANGEACPGGTLELPFYRAALGLCVCVCVCGAAFELALAALLGGARGS